MYEYAPQFEKKAEKWLVAALVSVAALLFGTSMTGIVPYPAFFQLGATACLAVGIVIVSGCLLKRYVYTVEDGGDFVITEYTGSRKTVVCRVSVGSVESVSPVVTDGKEKQEKTEKKEEKRFNYTGTLFCGEKYDVRVREQGETFSVRICADAGLIARLCGK